MARWGWIDPRTFEQMTLGELNFLADLIDGKYKEAS